MSDNIRFGSIPVFAGALAFLPACTPDTAQSFASAGESTSTTADDTSGSAGTRPSDGSTMTDPTDPTDPTGVPECVTCGSEPPDGWFGPVVYARLAPGEEAPACPPEVAEPGPTLLDGFVDPGPAVCSCSCENPVAQDCSADMTMTWVDGYYGATTGYYGATTGYYGATTGYYGASGYVGESGYVTGGGSVSGGYYGTGGGTDGGYGGSSGGAYYGGSTGGGYYGGTTDGYYGTGGGCYGGYALITETCLNIAVDGEIRFRAFGGYETDGGYYGACEKQESADIPVTEWAATITTCRLPEDTPGCEGGDICIPAAPAGFEQKWCLYRDGDAECPSADYPNKTVFWSNVDDTRACTDCSCGVATNSCEDAELLVFGEADCAGEPLAVLPSADGCVDVAMGQSVVGDFGSEAACPVTEAPEPEGSIAPSGPFTFCCSD